MINNNSGFKFSNLDADNQPITEELKPISLAELLAGHNHGDDEHEHDFAGSDSTNSEQISVSAAVINSPTATIDVNYYGFSQEAKNAFEYAVTIWEGWIKSDVAIEVDAYWEDLSQYGSGVLGAASPYSFKRNFTGATKNNTSYAMSLANHLAGEDLNGGSSEIEAWFNSGFSNWYFGTDGEAQKGKFDFTTVVLHELGHGFGFTDFIDYNNGKGSYGNTIFESFIVNSDNQSLDTFTNNSLELGAQLTSNNLFFNGVNATAANDGKQVKLYAPSKWEYGSSVAHLDEKTYPKSDRDSLMTPYFKAGEAIHNPGAIALGVLKDLGWDINQVDSKPVIEPPQANITILPPTAATPVEKPTTIPTLSFDTLESYGGQDKQHTLLFFDDNKAFEVKGNSWKKLAIDYKITSDTILEFEFNSIQEGEIQGIGFDTNDNLGSSDAKYLFRLSGTQNNFGITDFKYQTNSGWQSYQIRVGDYFTGEFDYLTFANDHDNGTKDAHSQYRNLSIYEEGQQPVTPEIPTPTVIDTTPQTPVDSPSIQPSIIKIQEDKLSSYAGQDKDSIFTISDNNQEIEIQGNGWKKLAFDYEITDKTILEFEFQSDIRGEIQGIGFDTDDQFGSSNDKKLLFQLEGKDKLGVDDFKQDITGKGWKNYQITVGDNLTGDFNYLTFVNDHDKGEKNAASKYRNIKLYEGDANKLSHATTDEKSNVLLTIKDSTNNYNLSSYGGITQDKGSFTLSDDKTEIELKGNSWNKLDLTLSALK
ncbi:hypothetical protein [Calothrix sp. CCY 0018]|uniref:hypothetical protein n=1 Tax=Calothrix sp. CCY 0018 TaxID=3103864 RepID=UPI0039C678A4